MEYSANSNNLEMSPVFINMAHLSVMFMTHSQSYSLKIFVTASDR